MIRGLITAFIALAAMQAAFAVDYPSRAIRIIVPYSAGGTSDTAARLIAEPLGRALGQSVYVENRGGAGGLSGTEAFFETAPDGYTLLLAGAGPVAIIPAAKAVPYVATRDLAPIGSIWSSPQVLAVNPKLGIATMAQLIAYAKANPGKLTVGSAGNGSLTHLSIELLKREAGIDVTHVPFRSTGGSLPALLGAQIDAIFGDVAVLAPHIRSGGIVALAIAAPERSPLVPDLITMGEAGLPGVEATNWYGLTASAKTPAAVLDRLKQAMAVAQADPGYHDNLLKQGVSAGKTGAEAFGALMTREIEKWQSIVKAANIRIE